MLQQPLIAALAGFIQATPEACAEMLSLAGQIINLTTPLFTINFYIKDGTLIATTDTPTAKISIPLSAVSQLIHKEPLRTFKQVKIEGNHKVARTFLAAVAKINPTDILYSHDSPLPGILALKLEHWLQSVTAYASLVTANSFQSLSHYAQYETETLANKYQIEEFCSQVDELTERCELLTKRVEKYKDAGK